MVEDIKISDLGEENTDNILSERENRSYSELLRKFIESEEELKVSNFKLQLSEEEIIKLKNQIKESEGHLDNVRKELKMKEDGLEYEKGRVLELQKQTTDLETYVPDCSHKIAKLNIQIEESGGQLDNVPKEIKIKEDNLEYEKGQVLELQKQTTDLETHIPDCSHKIAKLSIQIEESGGQLDNVPKELKLKEDNLEYEKGQVEEDCYKIAKLMEQLEVAREQLKVSNDEKTRLKEELKHRYCLNHELQGQLNGALEKAQKREATMEWLFDMESSQTRMLEYTMAQYKADDTEHDLERKKLKAENEQLHSDVKSNSKVQKQLEQRLKECEARDKVFERKLKQSEAVKLKLEKLNASQQMVLQGQISSLKEELDQGRHDVEIVNKEFDEHMQKYSMLMTEKDGANAKIDKLMAEVSSRDNRIANMKRELLQLQAQQAELISGSEARLNLVNELKLEVEELENEVTRQNAVIPDRAEEKREAIRQLCISLEHYKSEYQQLRFAFSGHELQAFRAS